MGNSHRVDGRAPVHGFYASSSWIEGAAVRQLEAVAAISGVCAVAGMPDLHPGKFGPVGCAILADHIHPAFVGSDAGCGMALFALDIASRRLRIDKAADRLRDVAKPYDGDIAGELAMHGLAPSDFDAALGTIGGGNHFCELQAVEEVFDPNCGIDRDRAYLLVHSGSRGLGHQLLERQVADGLRPLATDSAAGQAYLQAHDHALRWASRNRQVIAQRAAAALRCEADPVCECSHNCVVHRADGVLHRKGAAPSDQGLVVVPGSRGALSYLVAPLATAPKEALWSIAHGAGRKFDRSSMMGRVGATRSDRERLARNPFGGSVICEDRALLVEEAPEAYKPIAGVIGDLEAFGLARVVASFRPLVTVKKIANERPRREDRR
ncbi:RNA ligase RtcB family protein [Bradyrhizobium ontarionense]|uniref:3'-phosphate/5'-hydroxy nucleic acid ligase n=1 Tax=Bradyrhizobium ontarionense TaxID=2898149 RepID=A0ABY3R846_9BRAD|nr:RNA ligase RtcB family protein [Bradyrhizobium sp. A19]UFZ03212.1 RNA ligase RtcB family protein [Bradyrhizobium sp. A19]